MILQQLEISGEADAKEKIPKTLFRGRGCNLCNHTGFLGQTGIFEILQVTEGIRELILAMKPAPDIKKQAMKEGMATMFEDGLEKVEKGITTIEEVLRVVSE